MSIHDMPCHGIIGRCGSDNHTNIHTSMWIAGIYPDEHMCQLAAWEMQEYANELPEYAELLRMACFGVLAANNPDSPHETHWLPAMQMMHQYKQLEAIWEGMLALDPNAKCSDVTELLRGNRYPQWGVITYYVTDCMWRSYYG